MDSDKNPIKKTNYWLTTFMKYVLLPLVGVLIGLYIYTFITSKSQVVDIWAPSNALSPKPEANDRLDILELYRTFADRYYEPTTITFSTDYSNTNNDSDINGKIKEDFLNQQDVAFIFVDEQHVENRYNQYFKEPELTSYIKKTIQDVGAEVSTGEILGTILDSQLDSKNIEEYVETLKLPNTPVEEMFVKYKDSAIKQNNVSLGFDQIKQIEDRISLFDKELKELQDDFGIVIDESNRDALKNGVAQVLIEDVLSTLENISQFVLVKGKYLVERNGNYFDFTYRHPINDYIQSVDNEITITMKVPVNAVESSYKPELEEIAINNRVIPIHAYAKVLTPIDRETGYWQIKLVPYVIF